MPDIATGRSSTDAVQFNGRKGADAMQGFAAHPKVQLAVFAVTLFVSALLLFSVQPLFARLALPQLGGTPSVWAVSMCFFQAMLLLGYLYAHALNHYLGAKGAVFAHLALLALTVLALPIGIPANLGEPPPGDGTIWLLGVLLVGVGLPFFAISANAPMLQAWFSQTGHPDAKDPYFLYGASNLGSLVALLSYPILIEPMLGLSRQTFIWGLGFEVLVLLIGLSGAILVGSYRAAPALASTAGADNAAITTNQRLLWIVLAMIPSGLIIAVTTYISTDLAASPFLWVVPLAMFLGTFILVFRDRPIIPSAPLMLALPALVLLHLVWPGRWGRLILALLAFFAAAMICHRELYVRRPNANRLTEFYLWISFGGVIGGVFAALVAPQVFTSTFEFDVLLVGALLCLPGVLLSPPEPLSWRRAVGLGCLAAAAVIGVQVTADVWGERGQQIGMFALAIGLGVALLATRDWAERRVALMLGIAAIALTYQNGWHAIYTERSFFGTVRVMETVGGESHIMLHGTTLHGARRLKELDGRTIAEPRPTTYYHPAGALARGVDAARRAKAQMLTDAVRDGEQTPILIGVVGLGTGSMACHTRPGDAIRFFEIDPVVVRVARNPKLFDFLSQCAPQAPIIIGDARLTVAKEPADAFDYLVIDAFSSDTVPTHLITAEALRMYLSKLSETGILALHISNKYLDLVRAVSATVDQLSDVNAALVYFRPRDEHVDASGSVVMLLSRNPKSLDHVLAWPDAEGLPQTAVQPWTDDYADVMSAMWRQFRN